jgi:hypothetical protein
MDSILVNNSDIILVIKNTISISIHPGERHLDGPTPSSGRVFNIVLKKIFENFIVG